MFNLKLFGKILNLEVLVKTSCLIKQGLATSEFFYCFKSFLEHFYDWNLILNYFDIVRQVSIVLRHEYFKCEGITQIK